MGRWTLRLGGCRVDFAQRSDKNLKPWPEQVQDLTRGTPEVRRPGLRGGASGRETRWQPLAILLVTELALTMVLEVGRREGHSPEDGR